MSVVTLRRDLVRGLGGVAIAKAANLALVFAISILVARRLGPDGYGAYAFTLSVIAALALFSYLGLPELLVREAAKEEQAQAWGLIAGLLRRSQQLSAGTGTLLILAALTVAVILAGDGELDRWRLLLIALPMVPLIALAQLRSAVLRGLRRVILGNISEMVVRPALFLALFVALAFAGRDSVASALAAQVLAALGSLTLCILLFRASADRRISRATPAYRHREWLTALPPFMGLAGVGFLNVEFINIFLGLAGTNQDVALFRIAASLALFVALPLSLVENVIAPHITRLYHAGEFAALQQLTQVTSLGALALSALPALLLVIFGGEIITWLYGAEYAPAYPTLVIISLGYAAVNLVGLSLQLLYATEYHATAFHLSAAGAALTVLLCVALIPLAGPVGAGIVLGFGKVLRATIFVVAARRRLGIRTSLIW